jgi:hypothetical protein
MRIAGIILLLICFNYIRAQVPVDLKLFSNKNGASVLVKENLLSVKWPAGDNEQGLLMIDLSKGKPLFRTIGVIQGNATREIMKEVDPVFLLSVGKRDLVSQNGWNIFFDKVPLKPHETFAVSLNKKSAAVSSAGTRTIIRIGDVETTGFKGALEITVYNGSALFNIAAVVSTQIDSTAILYDAGLVTNQRNWETIGWSDVYDQFQFRRVNMGDSAVNQAVKYRTIIGNNREGNLAMFPAPHQYFYPLDEAFNLKFTWFGDQYRGMVKGYGIGIRQDLLGDKRFVPWFNAPPGTAQRLNFFCLISTGNPEAALAKVKAFTHDDKYVPLAGYKTMASHFHNEFIMKVVMPGLPVPDTPSFTRVFKNAGVNIVHLAEFHYTAHPKGPDDQRLAELHALHQQCKRLSGEDFLLLPGEEPNEFFGGHWLSFFPKPVYWIMSRKNDQPFITEDPIYGKVYRIGNSKEMLQLLENENGLAWTAHPRTKGSTGYPDKYRKEPFYLSDRFFGAAWKPIPADLSQPYLGNNRVLDLLNDMNNWGQQKKVIAEADLFTIEPENEMYAHMNINYLQLNKLPQYREGWQEVLDVLQQGKFFSTTGEVLITSFEATKDSTTFNLRWTFPMNYAEIISGDGEKVYRNRINLDNTLPFGEKTIKLPVDLKNRKWVRVEAWDIAANGAFTQMIWLK